MLRSDEYNCISCAHYDKCDLEAKKDRIYNLRDNNEDCFIQSGEPIPPWLDSTNECYGCTNHSYEDCCECNSI